MFRLVKLGLRRISKRPILTYFLDEKNSSKLIYFYRCSECFECPACDQLLLTRATSIQVPSAEDPSKTIPKKMFYLVCGYCRWTTREAGLPDQPVGN